MEDSRFFVIWWSFYISLIYIQFEIEFFEKEKWNCEVKMRTSSKRGEVIKDRLKKYGEEDGLENLLT
jgi:hypothetical protein